MTRGAADKDIKKFNVYVASVNDFASASLLDDTAASRFEHGELGNNLDRWYW